MHASLREKRRNTIIFRDGASMTALANKPDAANPAMTLWFTIDAQWRRVADLGRSAE